MRKDPENIENSLNFRRKTAHLSQVDRQRIVDCSRRLNPHWKKVTAEIKRNFGLIVSTRTCSRIWRAWTSRRSIKNARGQGRNRKCSRAMETAICNYARRHRFETLLQYCEFARITYNIDMCTRSMSNLLKRHGLFRRVAVRKPLLTAAAKEKRLGWARRHMKFSLWKWRHVIFSDEKIFRSDNNRRTVFVTRSSGEKFNKKCIQHTVKNATQVHVWGAVSWNGLLPLKRVNGNLNAQKYQAEIINDLAEVGDNLIRDGTKFTFQHDIAPAHNARTTHEFLRAHGIKKLEWPGNSPDLNIIENLWATVAARVRAHPTMPRNTEELWNRIHNAWNSITIDELRKLYRSINSRLKEVAEAHGGTTHY